MLRRTLLNDIIFKIVFGSPKNERLLRSLLNAILELEGEDKIVQLSLLANDVGKAYHDEKGAILDVRARDGHNRQYNIEVQLKEQTSYIQRSLFYLSKLYSEQLERGRKYGDLRRTVAISILEFPLFPDLAGLHTRFRFCDPRHNLELSDILEIHYLELSKFRRDQPLLTPLEKWLHVLRFAELYESGVVPLPAPIQREEEMIMALDAMHNAYSDDEVRLLIEARLRAEWDENTRLHEAMEKGEAKGEAVGEARARLEVAQKMAKSGIDAETILDITGVQL
ncbi:MAG: Rpn family recombination-promoting nuclease/putative transposase [Candidatus Eremiobacteraeota bacterium]|nr:Rpn family recombination-promoting nuclease/putative transposase [Candidatus Eremiobacteraeota bacterium]